MDADTILSAIVGGLSTEQRTAITALVAQQLQRRIAAFLRQVVAQAAALERIEAELAEVKKAVTQAKAQTEYVEPPPPEPPEYRKPAPTPVPTS